MLVSMNERGTLPALMDLIAVPLPAIGVAHPGGTLEEIDVALDVFVACNVLQVFANLLIETFPHDAEPFPGSLGNVLINGKGNVHRHRICAHTSRVKSR